MASQKTIAITVEQSQTRLRQSVPILADRFQVERPNLNIPKRYPLDFRRATELERISKFIADISQHEIDSDVQTESDAKLNAIKALVSQPMDRWTKQQLVDLVLGGES